VSFSNCTVLHNRQATYSLLKRIPVWRRIVEYLVLQGHSYLAEEVIAAEHVRMPDRQPQRPCLQAIQTHMELKSRDDEPSSLLIGMHTSSKNILAYIIAQLTFSVSLNSGFNVCFFTFVFLFPLFDLSGNRYTLTYLKKFT